MVDPEYKMIKLEVHIFKNTETKERSRKAERARIGKIKTNRWAHLSVSVQPKKQQKQPPEFNTGNALYKWW